jgi:hypothetical protein
MTASSCLVILSLLSIAAAATAAVAGADDVVAAGAGDGAGACRASAGTLKLLKASRRPREISQTVPSVARNASGLLTRQDDVSTAGHLKNETGRLSFPRCTCSHTFPCLQAHTLHTQGL